MRDRKKKLALLSVYDKTGIVEFARELISLGFDIISSGGTAKVLMAAGIEVTDVAKLVGSKAILGHRVVTLSRQVHAGLLARPDVEEDLREMADLVIPFIDLVYVNMYPLAAEIANVEATEESVTEQTDIGGPTMLSSAAKGGRIVICDPADCQKVIDWIKDGGHNRKDFLRKLAAKAHYTVAMYRGLSAMYHGEDAYRVIGGVKMDECKYGENAYMTPAGLYSRRTKDQLALDKFHLLSGTPMSYNNFCDLDRALQTMTHICAAFSLHTENSWRVAIGVKHGNACGAAVSGRRTEAVKKMVEGDTLAIFGGLVMCNFTIDAEVAELLLTHKMPKGQRRLLDGIIASDITEEAIELLKRKGDKCRMVVNPAMANLDRLSIDTAERFRYVRGGILVQPNYTYIPRLSDERLQKIGGAATHLQEMAMLLAKTVCDTTNSNTITIAKAHRFSGRKDSYTYYIAGNGAGQQARVHCANLAIERARTAGHNLRGAVAASDSFFPEIDGPATLMDAGIKTIFSTSGSKKDEHVVSFCKGAKIKLYLIPDKDGRGFFAH